MRLVRWLIGEARNGRLAAARDAMDARDPRAEEWGLDKEPGPEARQDAMVCLAERLDRLSMRLKQCAAEVEEALKDLEVAQWQ